MAAGGSGGTFWIRILVAGVVLVGAAFGLDLAHVGPGWLVATCQAIGGLAVVFGSCEALILCVQGLARRLSWNTFVAGTMAGLASNVPEVVMLGFVLAKEPRVGFLVVALTLHVGTLAFGIYSVMLPRDEFGQARLPEPLVKLSTDLYACAGGVFLAMGGLMLAMKVFDAGTFRGEALTAGDLWVVGGALLLVEVVAIWRLVARFSGGAAPEPEERGAGAEPLPSIGQVAGYGVLGVVTSVIGGHAVGEFAETLVHGLAEAGYSEMLGALVLSVFASAGALAMIAASHAKGLHDVALAGVSGAITQVPFVVLPIAMILIAVFTQTGVVPGTEHGGALPIDLETVSVLLLGFPPMLVLWKAIQDDGMVNWVETTTMTVIFGLIVYFLAVHG